MFQSWRFKLREAEEAPRRGQLDEARQRLERDGLVEFLPGKRLASRLSLQLAARAKQHAASGNQAAAWQDAETALKLGGETRSQLALQRHLVDAGVAAIEQRLAADDAATALTAIEALEKRAPDDRRLQELRQVVQRLKSTTHLVRRGKFAEAEVQLGEAIALRPDTAVLRRRLEMVQQKREQSRPVTELLHRALADAAWSDAVTLADELLELAPESRLAREARRRAWAHVGPQVSPRPRP